MEIDAQYNPNKIEKKWYNYWIENKCFESQPNEKPAYTIVIPPPNVTGILHMGHMLNNTIQDVLVRRARMRGFNACWVPGTDHASIATEAKVVHRLREKGIKKSDLTREKFMEHAWEWTHQYGGIILEQLKQLGASCDWSRTTFTMDAHYYEAVIKVFVDLHQKGYIYRGTRMVNWDPIALTALSDEEVIHREETGKMYDVRYPFTDSDAYITVATTRPETILADVAICVHPQDERYASWIGKKVRVPFTEREIPIIADEYVDPTFGTGCLKITPAHDKNDYIIGKKHDLPIINILEADGKLNEIGGKYAGQDRFQARKNIVEDLKKIGLLTKEETHINKIGYSERTHAVIEPRLSLQWFCKMQDLSKPALKALVDGEVKFYPKKFENTYKHWMNNIQDWCISRQLWWGHRIPAYFYGKGENEYVVAENVEKALLLAKQKTENPNLQLSDLKQDEDAMDTWFSSWIWPMEVFKGISQPYNADFLYYYPTADLVTAPEILFFWVARMMMAGEEYTQKAPFKNVYYTGIVRDKLGRKMSKSLGNSPDPLDLIQKYGADAVRIGMLFSSPAGNDLPFDQGQCEQGRNFAGKIWNALRLFKSWTVEERSSTDMVPPENKQVINWMNSKINAFILTMDKQFEAFKISEALMGLYKIFWDDFCAWYLEVVKPPFSKPIDRYTYEQTARIFEKLLILLHPFMPFITEEIFHNLAQRQQGDSISMQDVPQAGSIDEELLLAFEESKELVTQLRNLRAKNQIPQKEILQLQWNNAKNQRLLEEIIRKLAHVQIGKNVAEKKEKSSLESFSAQMVKKADTTNVKQGLSFVVKDMNFFIPYQVSSQTATLELNTLKKEVEYLKGFVELTKQKTENTTFLQKAPSSLVAVEQKKIEDAMRKIAVLNEKIQSLSGGMGMGKNA